MTGASIKNYTLKVLFFLMGCFIIQIGVSFFIQSNTGVDSMTIFMQGLSNLINITIGQANILYMGLVLILMAFVARGYINVGTFLAVATAGPFLDFINLFTSEIPLEHLNYFIRALIVIPSCFIVGVGFSILKSSTLGVAPTDELGFIIVDFTGWQYKWVRIGMDFIYVLIGFFLGGVLGIGTVITTLAIGPFIQFLLPKFEAVIYPIIGEEKPNQDLDSQETETDKTQDLINA